MKLIEFKQKKYWANFVELKKIQKEYRENEKKKKKYFVLKNNPETRAEAWYLARDIIW